MGVDISVWADTIRRHPKTYKFKGIKVTGTDPRECAIQDESFMNNWTSRKQDYHYKNLEAAITGKPCDSYEQLENYAEYLGMMVRAGDADAKEGAELMREIRERSDKSHMRAVVERLEEIVGEHRFEWACDQTMFECESIREMDLACFLKDHPPVEIKDHATERFYPVEDVAFMCPSCGIQPCMLKNMQRRSWRTFYCGFCGASSCIDRNQTVLDFIEALDIEVFPYSPERRTHFMKHVYTPYFKLDEADRFNWLTHITISDQ